MKRFRLRSQRQKAQKGEPVLYQYDQVPKTLRNQVTQILSNVTEKAALFDPTYNSMNFSKAEKRREDFWLSLYKRFIYEKGLLEIGQYGETPFQRFLTYILSASDQDVLDAIDLIFFAFYQISIDEEKHDVIREQFTVVINALNERFNINQVGYEFVSGELIRVDSQYLHTEAVEPALHLLNVEGFAGAIDEFLQAHDHYRHQRYKDAITDASNALESTLKTICDNEAWPYKKQKATVSKLLEIVVNQGLFSPFIKDSLDGLNALAKALQGVGTIRNKQGGHGQGATVVDVPQHLAAFVLHQTAANIVFLVQSYQHMRHSSKKKDDS